MASRATKAAARLPVFVYGTLLPGFTNHATVIRSDVLRSAPATLKDTGWMYHFKEGYPGVFLRAPPAVAAPDTPAASLPTRSDIRGAVLWLRDDTYEAALSRLDELEEYYGEGDSRNLYDRREAEVVLDGADDGSAAAEAAAGGEPSTVLAWVYECLVPDSFVADATWVEDGHWEAFVRSTGAKEADDSWRARVVDHRDASAAASAESGTA